MNLFAYTTVKYFCVQHSALDVLKRGRPILKFSASKLYLWLCSASRGGVVDATAATISTVTGLDADTVQSAREELVRLGLITAELELGQGAIYTYTVLNLKTNGAFRSAEDAGIDGYFQVPHLFLHPSVYTTISGTTVLVYSSVLAQGNRLDDARLRYSKAKLAEITKINHKTLSKALIPLITGELPFLKMEPGQVEILNPNTGRSLSPAEEINDGLHFLDDATGRTVSVNELLTKENYKLYFKGELEDLDPEVTQQDVCCPFHPDTHPSMSVNLDEGIWFCHVCQNEKSGMLAFEMNRLGTEDEYIAWKSIAKKLGVRLTPRRRGAMTHEHVYTAADGEVLYVVRRYEDGSARFCTPTFEGKWRPGLNGVGRVPYNLPALMQADVVIITEGEKKADIVKALGLLDQNGKPVAVTCTGAADSWRPEYVEYFLSKRVILFPDSDVAGQRYLEAVTASLKHAAIEYQVVDFEGFGNDVRDFLKDETAAALVEYAECEWLATAECAAVSVVEQITADLSMV